MAGLMRKVYQTHTACTDDDPGNCWAACIATMLGLAIEDVPDSFRWETDAHEGWEHYAEFLKGYGFAPVAITLGESIKKFMGGTKYPFSTIVHGRSPRSDCNHGVIYRRGRLWHDPMPGGSGVLKIFQIELWLPLDTNRLIRNLP